MRDTVKNEWIDFVRTLQDTICKALEMEDGTAKFHEDQWERPEGGGGITRVIQKGTVFEKGGVNTSVVFGNTTPQMAVQLKLDPTFAESTWFACGLSLVLHPFNPYVPTVHCNYRMFELHGRDGNLLDRWFGGGTDLTPYYLFEADARHFHGTHQRVLNGFDTGFYPVFKKNCDDYFVNTHRNNERRGIGGIFYDYQRPDQEKDVRFWMNVGKACGNAFTEAYLPIVQRRKETPFGSEHKYWQEIRRGRYTEFNLVHDRGTLFGLRTNGRIESILMSLPPTVRFDYAQEPEPGSEEEKLLRACLVPQTWASH